MGKKGRRNTVKTGSKAASRKNEQVLSTKTKPEDPIYDDVDRFHNERDFVALDESKLDQDGEDEVEAVMDLAIGGDDSSSSDSPDESEGSSDSEEEEEEQRRQPLFSADPEIPSDNDDILEDNDDEDEEVDVRNWGQKKSIYYSGEADAENEEDAFDEEEAAKEVQRERFSRMAEEDFMILDDDEEEAHGKDTNTEASDLSKASKRQRLKKLDKEHPELLPMLNHFSQIAREMQTTTMVATKAIFEGEKGTAQSIGANKAGLQLLLGKAIVQTSTTLNLAVYLMLKREAIAQGQDASIIQTHPIMSHLQKMDEIHTSIRTLEDKHGIPQQLRNVVKAAALLSGDAISASSESEEEESSDSEVEDNENETVSANTKVGAAKLASDNESSTSSDDDSSRSSSSSNDEEQRAQTVMTEARFGLRATEVSNVEPTRKRRRALMVDAGDDEEAETRSSKKPLAATLNSIEQRTATKTRKSSQKSEDIDDDTKVRRALEMMEDELGPASSEEEGEQSDEIQEDDEEEDDDDNEFYNKVSKRSKQRREMKKKLHEVAPKFPRVDGLVEGERAANRQIIKNRGLVAHKKKINRNPRVKKREQFRKALIRRKGAVREVRQGEVHKYGGEETGIKTNLTRSRKLT